MDNLGAILGPSRADLRNAVRPNFVVVGAMRCGTTSLYGWLRLHPDVFMPDGKELHYFEHRHENKFADWRTYLSLFVPGRGKRAVGEATPSYLTKPESAAWIKLALPDARIIMILRDPVARAHSHYGHALMNGRETSPTFEGALAQDCRWHETERSESEAAEHGRCYFYRGFYYHQVKRYLDHFAREAVRIYLFEDLLSRPEEIHGDLCRFLGIAETPPPPFPHRNRSRAPRFVRWHFPLRTLADRGRQFGRLGMSLNLALGGRVREPLPRTAAWLRSCYREDVLKLAALIGRDLSAWLRPDPKEAS